ncbi:hypothetical protein ATCC90586_007181 [Pythium insidiosum]|nr:hypothetical protein ATCC90586_007181 [Pythium insidiosum]
MAGAGRGCLCMALVAVAFAVSVIALPVSPSTPSFLGDKRQRTAWNVSANAQHSESIARPRRLDDGLGCDLSLYDAFINSEAGQDIFIMATMCESRIKYIKNIRAGKFGPVEQADLYSAMCSPECLRSDELHQLAMSQSRCTCVEVSTKTYLKHDFCLENSARLLCTHLGECGHWGCEVHDFMCLRHEWDRYYTCGSLELRVSTAVIAVVTVVTLWQLL